MKKDNLINLIIVGSILAIIDYTVFTSDYFLFPLIALNQGLSTPENEEIFIRLTEGFIIFIEIIFLIVFVKRAAK